MGKNRMGNFMAHQSSQFSFCFRGHDDASVDKYFAAR
jgi:hypothetical protein